MFTASLTGGGQLTYLARNDWGAGPLRRGVQLPSDRFKGLVVHHTVMVMADYDRDGFLHGDTDDIIRYMRLLQEARPDLGSEVPYSWVVFEGDTPNNAVVCEGRGYGITGAHTKGFNSKRYGVAIAGNTMDRAVSDGMIAAIRWIGARMLDDPTGAAATVGHRDTGAQTACPGTHMYGRLVDVQPPFRTAPAPPPEEPIIVIPAPRYLRTDDNRYAFSLDGSRAGTTKLTTSDSVRAHRQVFDPDGEIPQSVEIPAALFDDLTA